MTEAGQAVNALIEALKSQPTVVALILVIFGLLGFQFYEGHQTVVARNQYVTETQQLLARCMTIEELEKLERSLRQ